MIILGKPNKGKGCILVLVLAVFGLQLISFSAFAELANDEVVFIDFEGNTCGIVSAATMSIVSTFDCDEFSEGIDITSDGARAVIGNCVTNTLTLIDLTSVPPLELEQIESSMRCVAELDIAPDNSFGIATGAANGIISKFTLEPFEITETGGPWEPDNFTGGSPQDVHLNSSGTVAVQPMFWADYLVTVDISNGIPQSPNKIPSPLNPDSPDTPLRHQGISLSQYDDDTFLATSLPFDSPFITVGSVSGFFNPFVLDAPGNPESVDISCDGTRAVVETSEGLMWLDLEAAPPVVLDNSFGPARTDGQSTSTVAFSSDGTLLFVAGQQQIDIYDVKPDQPLLRGSIPMEGKIYSVAALPCSAASSEIRFTASPIEIEVAVDIRPRSCPNRLNLVGRGIFPVAILGSEDFDVHKIDPQTVEIAGISPQRWKIKDVATPYDTDTMQGNCKDCNSKGPDGYLDLVLQFKKKDIVKAIGSVNHDECHVLLLTGATKDGRTIVGDDVVRIQERKRYSKEWFKRWFFSWLKAHKKYKKNER